MQVGPFDSIRVEYVEGGGEADRDRAVRLVWMVWRGAQAVSFTVAA
ncbi:hypothetical protein ABZ814_32055 [Micromonospora musae]